MPPGVLNNKVRNKQINVEHNFMKYSYSYMFRPYRVIIRSLHPVGSLHIAV